jgi:hypothetical protein
MNERDTAKLTDLFVLKNEAKMAFFGRNMSKIKGNHEEKQGK